MAIGDGNYMFFTVGAGQIWFTRRAGDGSWAPALQETNPKLPGEAAAQAVSTQGTAELQHLAIVADGGELWHSLWDSQGRATVFGDVQATAAGRVGGFMDVDAAHGLPSFGPPWPLFVVGCTVDGKLWYTIRKPDGTWQPFKDIQAATGAGQIGPVRNVSCTHEPHRLTSDPEDPLPAFHVVALTRNYRLFHTRHDFLSGAFSPFVDIETAGAGEAGNFSDVSCAWASVIFGNRLHVCAVADDTVKHTMMFPSMTWAPFFNVKTEAGDPGRIEKVACAMPSIPIDPNGQAVLSSPLSVVVLTSEQKAWRTGRLSFLGTPGTWGPS